MKVIIPGGWLKDFPEIKASQWQKWWTALAQLKRMAALSTSCSPLLLLYSLHPGKHMATKITTDKFPNNAEKSCVLCETVSIEAQEHFFSHCEISWQIWKAGWNQNTPFYQAIHHSEFRSTDFQQHYCLTMRLHLCDLEGGKTSEIC